MSKRLKIRRLLVLTLAVIVRTAPQAIAQTTSPASTKAGVVVVSSLVVDSFDSVGRWSTSSAQGVEVTIHPDSGRHGAGVRLDFDFHGHPGYGVIHRELDLDLPANYEFTFALRGDAPSNTLEFKLVDASGANVWWSNNPYFVFPREWRTIARAKGQICFAWGQGATASPCDTTHDHQHVGRELIFVVLPRSNLPSQQDREEREASGSMTSFSLRLGRIRLTVKVLARPTMVRRRLTSSFRLSGRPRCSSALQCRNIPVIWSVLDEVAKYRRSLS